MLFKEKDEGKNDPLKSTCSYRIENPENKWIIFECQECENAPSIGNSNCKTGILKAFSSESNIKGIILSDYVEKAYEGDSIEILKKYQSLIEQMEEFTLSSQNKISRCSDCKFKPENVFSHLQDSMYLGFEDYYKEFQTIAKDLDSNSFNEEACEKCVQNTKEDMIYIFNKLEDLRADIYERGFNILI